MSFDATQIQPRISRRQFLFGSAATLAAGAGAGLYSYGPGRHHLDTIYHEVFIPDLPAAFEGFRIAQLSDFHFGPYAEADILQHAVDRVNAMQPDLVALTGDYITFLHYEEAKNLASANECASLLSGLKAPLRYASLGNHDMPDTPEVIQQILEAHNLPVLRNSNIPLDLRGDRIWLAGLADVLFDDPDPQRALPTSRQGQPVIVLGHEPDYVDDVTNFCALSRNRCDLYLAGHTHGGQVNIPGLRRLALPQYGVKYIHGPFQVQNTLLYVNRGLGTVHMPLRFNAPPEITLFKLKSK